MANGNDIPPNSVCCKCGEKNTLERDPDGDLHCWACGTDQKGKNPEGDKGRMSDKGSMTHQQIMERHKFFEDNKQAILSDVQSLGRTATCKKWDIVQGTLAMILARWQQEPKVEPPEEKKKKTPPLPGHNSNILLELPAFSNDWTPEVQMKWLEIYDKLIERGV